MEIELPFSPAIPLLDIHIEETRIERDTCTPVFIAALFTIARTWKQSRLSISRWMDKKAVIHIHNGILLSHQKCIWISSNEVDETGAYYTEWSKSERKTPMQYTNTYIWNLERWQQWPYMQDSKRDTDVKNSLLDSVGEGQDGMIWENSIETCILSYAKQITSPGLMHETGCSGLVH